MRHLTWSGRRASPAARWYSIKAKDIECSKQMSHSKVQVISSSGYDLAVSIAGSFKDYGCVRKFGPHLQNRAQGDPCSQPQQTCFAPDVANLPSFLAHTQQVASNWLSTCHCKMEYVSVMLGYQDPILLKALHQSARSEQGGCYHPVQPMTKGGKAIW